MSQKVKITRARVHGSPVYLGDVTAPDTTVGPVWSADPARVAGWLCDGFRFRFNQRRSTRCRYLTCEDRAGDQVVVSDPAGVPCWCRLVPRSPISATPRRGGGTVAALNKQRKFHQRRMAKSKVIATRQGRRFWDSKRYQTHKTAAAGLAAKQVRVREDFAHKLSTRLVRGHDFIGIEKLSLDRMTRRGKGAGAAQKRGLNRALRHSALGKLAKCIEYKANLAEVPFSRCPPPTPVSVATSAGTRARGTVKAKRCSVASRVAGLAMLTPTPPSTCVRKPSRGGRRTPNNWLGHPVRSRAGSLPSARRGARVRPTPTRVRPLGRRHLR